jgi:hypothetical protein
MRRKVSFAGIFFFSLFTFNPTSKTKAIFEGFHAVAGDGEFGACSIFQAHHQPSAEPSVHFVNVIKIEQDGSMDAHEARRVKLLFEFGNGAVYAEVPFGRGGIRQFVLREKVRDLGEFKQANAFAAARSDTRGKAA